MNREICFGTLLIITGSVLAVTFGSRTDEEYSIEDVVGNITVQFLLYMSFNMCIGICLALGIRFCRKMEAEEAKQGGVQQGVLSVNIDDDDPSGPLSPRMEGTGEMAKKIAELGEIQAIRQRQMRKGFIAVAYPLLAGIIGSYTQLFAKAASEMIAATSNGNNQFKTVGPYLMIFCVLLFGGTQIHLVNMGLKTSDQMVVIPTFVVSLSLFSITAGLIFWQEFANFGVVEWVMFPVGVLLTFSGVYFNVLGRRRHAVATEKAAPKPLASQELHTVKETV
jgi:hypothetical protein